MKNVTYKLLFLCLLFTSLKNYGQCGSGTVTLSTQLDVNNFMSTIPNCTTFTGNLDISGADISDLSPLSPLTSVLGNLRIWNAPLLTNLHGLHNLTSINGDLELNGFNFPLVNLNGLSSLQHVGGMINMDSLQSLISINGLSSLTTVVSTFRVNNCNNNDFTSIAISSLITSGNFYLGANNKLTSINFSGLQSVGKSFQLVNNPLLVTVNFSALTIVGLNLLNEAQINTGFFEVRLNSSLLNPNFSSLTTIKGQMDIIQNAELQNLGFQNLTSVMRTIRITANPVLSSLSGLQLTGVVTSFMLVGSNVTNLNALANVTTIGALDYGDLIIQDNPLLSDLSGLLNITLVNKSLEIRNNDSLLNLNGLNALTTIGTGNLAILDNALLTEINGLQNLTSVGATGNLDGVLILNNPALLNLTGLASLATLKGSFTVRNNSALTDVSDVNITTQILGYSSGFILENNDALVNLSGMTFGTLKGHVQILGNELLQSVDFTIINPSEVTSLLIDNNPSLQTILGLGTITQISGGFRVINNDSLQNLNGLNFTFVGGAYLFVKDNDGLLSLNGLSSLISVGNDTSVEIINNAMLNNINGLQNLTKAGRILVQNNPLLLNIDGLHGITFLSMTSSTKLLSIFNNAVLESIQGIRNINQNTIASLTIATNPNVAVCDLKNICQYLGTAKPRLISSNQAGCNSVAEVQSSCPTIWNGSSWSDGFPSGTRSALIEGDLNLSTSLSAKNFTVNSGIFKILSDASLNISGSIINNLQPENFIVEKNGNLVQPGSASLRKNNGAIKVYAENAPFKRLDYTIWSSPVKNQNLFGFSPATINGVTNYIGSTGRIYSYEGASGYVNSGPFTEYDIMNSGKGYLFRAPNNWSSTVASAYQGQFIGEPSNGNTTVSTHLNNFTSVGNPYPSTIDALELFAVNPNLGALYFWTNTNAVVNGAYAQNNYASYTAVGGVAASGSGSEPTQYIAVGQGFIAYNSSTQMTFTNDMRTGDVTNFFRTSNVEKSRFWLNLKGENDVQFNQILLSYMTGATNGFDYQMDGKLFGYNGSALYSLIDNEKFSIQAKSLPFSNTDAIPLGFLAENAGNFTISLANFDGLFAEGNVTIYIKDNQTTSVHNIMQTPYTFQSNSGTFNERFEVVYQTTLGVKTPELNQNVLIYKSQNQIVIKSSDEIHSVAIYDLLGRKMFNIEDINATQFQINSSDFGSQVLLISVECKGKVITQKLVN